MARPPFDKAKFIDAIKQAQSAAEALRLLGRVPAGGNYKVLYSKIERLGLDTSQWLGQAHLRGKTHTWAKCIPLEKILVSDSPYRGSTSLLKKRILSSKLLAEKCAICGISEWLGIALVLHIDHLNGINNDHRLENLRLLCPNCHSQTLTYCGRNRRRQGSKRVGAWAETGS